MRRSDREVTDRARINEIIRSCSCCRLGFYDGSEVYIVPLSFGYEDLGDRRIFYFHGAKSGRKISLITDHPSVGFELDTNYAVNAGENACSYSARFQSVIGTGRVSLLDDPDQKRHALKMLMLQNSGRADWEFPDAALDHTAVFFLEVDSLSCKEHS